MTSFLVQISTRSRYGTPMSSSSSLTIASALKSAPQSTKAPSSSPGRTMSFSRPSSVIWNSRLWVFPMQRKFWMLSRTMSRTEMCGCKSEGQAYSACLSSLFGPRSTYSGKKRPARHSSASRWRTCPDGQSGIRQLVFVWSSIQPKPASRMLSKAITGALCPVESDHYRLNKLVLARGRHRCLFDVPKRLCFPVWWEAHCLEIYVGMFVQKCFKSCCKIILRMDVVLEICHTAEMCIESWWIYEGVADPFPWCVFW